MAYGDFPSCLQARAVLLVGSLTSFLPALQMLAITFILPEVAKKMINTH